MDEKNVNLNRLLKLLSILSLIGAIGAIFSGLMLSALFGVAAATPEIVAQAEDLGVSLESIIAIMTIGAVLSIVTGVLGIIRSVRGFRSAKNPAALASFVFMSEIILAVNGVSVVWRLSQAGFADTSTILYNLAGILFDAACVGVGIVLRRQTVVTEEQEQAEKTRKLIKERRKLGLIRLIQASYAINIIFSFSTLLFITRDEMVYNYMTAVDWINLSFHVVCFWLIWKRLKMARTAVIVLSVVNIILNTVYYVFIEPSTGAWILSVLVDTFVILYFLFSKRPREAFVNEMSHERRIDTDGGDYIAKKGWPRWRNLILYYCVFSVLGHWMELGFCMLIRAGLVAGEYDPTNTMLWRDLLFPFPMEGIAVVICALWLYPFKNWLIEKIKVPFVPLFISFLVNGLLCSVLELVGGLLANPNHELWDYSNMPFNFMGQVCLQNAIGFGLACTLIAWVVYPALERAIAHVPNDIMNVVFVGALAFNLILQILYLVEPAEIAAAFNQLGNMIGGGQAASRMALLPWLRF